MYTVEKFSYQDGTEGYNILNIPLVSEYHPCQFSENNRKTRYSKDVINSMFAEFQKAEKGYMIPVHLGHHSEKGNLETVALCEITHMEEKEGFGLTIFGNIKYIDSYLYEQIAKGKIPYWSTETLDNDSSGSINSLALLGNGKAPEFAYSPFVPENLNSLIYNEKKIENFWRKKNMEEEKDIISEELENESEEGEAIVLKDIVSKIDMILSILQKQNEKEEEEPEDLKTASVTQNSKRLVELAREYPKAKMDTLLKFIDSGLSSDDLKNLSIEKKVNEKGSFATVAVKENTKYTDAELKWLKNERQRYALKGIEGEPVLTESMKKTLKLLEENK